MRFPTAEQIDLLRDDLLFFSRRTFCATPEEANALCLKIRRCLDGYSNDVFGILPEDGFSFSYDLLRKVGKFWYKDLSENEAADKLFFRWKDFITSAHMLQPERDPQEILKEFLLPFYEAAHDRDYLKSWILIRTISGLGSLFGFSLLGYGIYLLIS